MRRAAHGALALLWLATLPALAQEQAEPKKEPATSQAAPKDSKDSKRSRRVIRLESITVEGRIQKPEALYILRRSDPELQESNRNESFVPKVVKSVEKEPL
jgi:hypothetical protein